MHGEFFLAWSKRSRTRLAPTPTNISTNSEPLMLKKGTPASPATALLSSVLPVPGGPTSSTPLGMRAPTATNLSGYLRNSTISFSSCFASSTPATSTKVIAGLSPASSRARLRPKDSAWLLPLWVWRKIHSRISAISPNRIRLGRMTLSKKLPPPAGVDLVIGRSGHPGTPLRRRLPTTQRWCIGSDCCRIPDDRLSIALNLGLVVPVLLIVYAPVAVDAVLKLAIAWSSVPALALVRVAARERLVQDRGEHDHGERDDDIGDAATRRGHEVSLPGVPDLNPRARSRSPRACAELSSRRWRSASTTSRRRAPGNTASSAGITSWRTRLRRNRGSALLGSSSGSMPSAAQYAIVASRQTRSNGRTSPRSRSAIAGSPAGDAPGERAHEHRLRLVVRGVAESDHRGADPRRLRAQRRVTRGAGAVLQRPPRRDP